MQPAVKRTPWVPWKQMSQDASAAGKHFHSSHLLLTSRAHALQVRQMRRSMTCDSAVLHVSRTSADGRPRRILPDRCVWD